VLPVFGALVLRDVARARARRSSWRQRWAPARRVPKEAIAASSSGNAVRESFGRAVRGRARRLWPTLRRSWQDMQVRRSAVA